MTDAYDELVHRSRQRALLASCLELLGWDELTYMPAGGVEYRGQQMAYLAGRLHDEWADPKLGALLDQAAESTLTADPHGDAAANLRHWRREQRRATLLPRTLVEELAHVATLSQQQWADARAARDFRLFLPWLERVLRLKQAEAACLCGAGVPYDALLDEYEPGMTSARLTALFDGLRPELSQLLARIAAAPRRSSNAILERDYPVERQQVFAELVAAAIGFDFERGRLDSTTHPFFSAIGPGDCRITTRYHAQDFSEAFFSVLHELGHGLYEQGLDRGRHGTPCGAASSLGIHESQSRLWENCVGRSRAFWQGMFPRAQAIFHDALHDVQLDDFHRAVNHVAPDWCRVRADEASYDLHVLLRFELEQVLISGDLPPAELPAAWNEASRRLLGLVPEDDAQGCLQDGHWSAGQFGYFPTYTLGNLYAAEMFAAFRRAFPEGEREFARGQFTPLREWLAENLYRHGQRHTPAELVERFSGRPLGHETFTTGLREKYAELYRF